MSVLFLTTHMCDLPKTGVYFVYCKRKTSTFDPVIVIDTVSSVLL